MLKLPLITLFILVAASSFLTGQNRSTAIDQYNVVWNSQSKNSGESMPLVGGDIACNVWVENGELLFYMSRSGSFSENGTYLKLGRVRIKLSPNPFSNDATFRQELKLKNGFIEIEGKSPSLRAGIRVWVEVLRPVIHVDIDASKPVGVEASYESWRTEDRELPFSPGGERFACFNLEGYPGKVMEVKDEIGFLNHGVLFYHRNPAQKLIPEILIKQQGLEASADKITDDLKDRTFGGYLSGKGFSPSGEGAGTYLFTEFKFWKIKSDQPRQQHQLTVVTNIEQAAQLSDWKDHLFKLAAVENQQADFKKTTTWWNNFWERSWIIVSPGKSDAGKIDSGKPKIGKSEIGKSNVGKPENGNPALQEKGKSDLGNPVLQMARNYQLFRYQLGGNAFGEYPTKFNGGSLTVDPGLIEKEHAYNPDWRKWGGSVFTAQNQRLLYWPMLKSGDFDAILPQFELYRKGLPGATARVATHFGHAGAVFCEYTSVPGLAFGDGWGWDNPKYRNRGTEIPFGDPRVTGARGYDDLVEKGEMANPSVAYHWESQVEHAYMILEYHRFSGLDISQYMPFIKSAVLFFDEHYQLREKMRTGKPLDQNGKLVIYPSTSCESYRGAKNPSDLIAGLRACLKSMLELDEKLLSKKDKDYYRGFLNRIPDYTFGEVNGLRIIQPAESWLKESNVELPQFYPLFPFNQFQLGDKEMQTFKNAYQVAPAFRKGNIISWHQDGIMFARMGMTKEAANYNTRKLADSNRRYPTFWGPGHDWTPDHNQGGAGMIGLQEMLMQTIGDKILLFPAWPKEWDVNFKLHAPKNTTVEVNFKNGEIVFLKVTPATRKKDVVVSDFN
ncbi:MAG: DUF5703 domain-containing protein [Prolixibacteraceae bacterium]